jgi:hypothetical protein
VVGLASQSGASSLIFRDTYIISNSSLPTPPPPLKSHPAARRDPHNRRWRVWPSRDRYLRDLSRLPLPTPIQYGFRLCFVDSSAQDFSLLDSEARRILSTPTASTLIMVPSISQLLPDPLPLTLSSRTSLVSWDTNKYIEPFDDGRNNNSKANDVHLYRFCLIGILSFFCNKQHF